MGLKSRYDAGRLVHKWRAHRPRLAAPARPARDKDKNKKVDRGSCLLDDPGSGQADRSDGSDDSLDTSRHPLGLIHRD